jgi:hypothetical protein
VIAGTETGSDPLHCRSHWRGFEEEPSRADPVVGKRQRQRDRSPAEPSSSEGKGWQEKEKEKEQKEERTEELPV